MTIIQTLARYVLTLAEKISDDPSQFTLDDAATLRNTAHAALASAELIEKDNYDRECRSNLSIR